MVELVDVCTTVYYLRLNLERAASESFLALATLS
jgi:hypothetical protein